MKKTYKLALTTTERLKLEIFLVMYENKLLDNAQAYETEEIKEFYSKETKKTLRSNAKWYKETYEIIHNIREKLDTMPF